MGMKQLYHRSAYSGNHIDPASHFATFTTLHDQALSLFILFAFFPIRPSFWKAEAVVTGKKRHESELLQYFKCMYVDVEHVKCTWCYREEGVT
jgi:hypothetical protein